MPPAVLSQVNTFVPGLDWATPTQEGLPPPLAVIEILTDCERTKFGKEASHAASVQVR
jgi:hypothetical protein